MQGEQFTCARAQPTISAQQSKGQADPHGAQRRFLRTGPARAAKGRVGRGPIGQKRLGLVQMIAFRVTLRGKRQGDQRGEAMGFPELADVSAGTRQHIQRMGFRAEGAMPVTLG